MPFAELNDLKFHFFQKGEGSDVVLIHGFTSSSAIWVFANVVETLAKSYKVTCYDLRGHGATTRPKTGYDSGTHKDDLAALLDHLKIDPPILVGHSLGGVVAAHYASEFPDRVRGMVFSDTYFPGLRELEPNMGQATVWQDLQSEFLKTGKDIGDQVNFELLFQVIATMTDDDWTIIQESMGIVGANWLSGLGPMAETSAGTEVFQTAGLTKERIKDISVPIVALYDEHSPFGMTREFIEQTLNVIATGIVPDAKHLAPLQNPEAFNELLEVNIRRLDEAANTNQTS